MNVVATQDLSKNYGRRRGISAVNLRVGAGEVFGFLGPNGAGKSTTIRVLMGFLRASSGTASILGLNCWSESHLIRQQVGYVPGDVRLYPWLTLTSGLKIVGGVRKADLTNSGMKLAERFRLEPDLPVRKMSRGNRQKLALVLALAHDPKLLIFDEPTSGLDPLMQDTLADCLRESAAKGNTVLFSSHTLSEVESLCDRVAIVRDGNIVIDESLQSLKGRAPRTVALRFRDEVDVLAIQLPEFLTGRDIRGQVLTTQMTGAADQLVQWAAQQPLDDISIGQPSLESLFRSYYDTSNSGRTEGAE